MTSVQIDSFRIALSGIAEAVTAGAQLRDEDFPYVTLPSFEIPANNLRRQAGAEFIMYSPLVENETAWQEYATQNIGWVNLSRAFEGALGNFDDSHLHQEIQIAPYMWYLDSQLQVMKAPGPRYAPVWQTSPPPVVPGEFLNHDLFADHGSRRTVAALIEAKGNFLFLVVFHPNSAIGRNVLRFETMTFIQIFLGILLSYCVLLLLSKLLCRI